MKGKTNTYLVIAILLGVAFHGTALFFTLESSYDALIHLFFGNHYAQSWFEPWNFSWYTGFTVMSYPPLVHQSIALLAGIGGLKFGLFTMAFIAIILFIWGVYRFSLLISGSRKVAGYAAILTVFTSAFAETLHLFGQLPSIIGIAILLHALPEIYHWIKTGKIRYLASGLSLLAITVTSHHVTPIFGMVFFIFPLIGMVLMDASKKAVGSYKAVTFRVFLRSFFTHFKRIIVFGLGSLALIILCILPYWINTKNNPITQVPIPHGSRDNLIEVASSGLVFFIIPWGVLLIILPYIFYRFFSKRYFFFGLSFTLLTILGTGGTTPIPELILGENIFNILTLDRFTLWATIMALPILGEFAHRLAQGDLRKLIRKRWGILSHKLIGGILAALFIFTSIFTISLGHFRPSQPDKIDTLPIVNFLNRDQHDQWRYLPLGFGDQMAWLSTQTKAMTVDGNYHSARRLPELTSRAVERLENSKFRGVEGIGSLQQFLTVPEKYHLKYVFSNDKFYDPLLYFAGWHRLQRLENGIVVWEREGVPPLPSILPKNEVPTYQKLLWGIVPMTTVIFGLLMYLYRLWKKTRRTGVKEQLVTKLPKQKHKKFNKSVLTISSAWAVLLLLLFSFGASSFYLNNATQRTPENVIKSYYDALDFKAFETAHSYLDPTEGKSLSQYMLEVSVSDGLLSSYAKLTAIEVVISEQTSTAAKAQVHTTWITPLQNYDRTFNHDLSFREGRWYLKPENIDLDIPPDQLFGQNQTSFFNHGKRRITSEKTHHEDVLKQPVIEITQARLVERDGAYFIIGSLQNIDNIPADVSLKGILYTSEGIEIANYDAKDAIKHKLLPKESTNFKIAFEQTAWLNEGDHLPTTFNPGEFSPASIKTTPQFFGIQATANVATTDLYDGVAIQTLTYENELLSGTLFNASIQNATIPQVILSYFTAEKELLWVEARYLEESVRPQRKLSFRLELTEKIETKTLNESLDLIFVNGLPNSEISKKMLSDRNETYDAQPYIGLQRSDLCAFVSIRTNNYIGNPK